MKNLKKKRSSLILSLLQLVKPLAGVMVIAIIMGTIGNLVAIFIPILGGYGLLKVLNIAAGLSMPVIITLIILFAVIRGVLRYAEQLCNHLIAFKLLARIRHLVFAAFRRLAPAKLDGKDKGNLLAVLTSDIELLEVFYAHTISPVAIAILTSLVMLLYLGNFSPWLALVAGIFYIVVGVVVPILNGRRGKELGNQYRKTFGDLNTVVLDNLYGLEEIKQYGQQANRFKKMQTETNHLFQFSRKLKTEETRQKIMTDTVILSGGIVMLLVSFWLIGQHEITFKTALISVVAMVSSFGPTAALSALSNNLNQTFASARRVLDILEEEPMVEEITGDKSFDEGDITCNQVSFSYPEEMKVLDDQGEEANKGNKGKKVNQSNQDNLGILKNFSLTFEKNKIYGIHGASGCGKSTLLKLLMRFYETDEGEIKYGSVHINEITTKELRKHISYVTQDTFLFQDTIENNLKIAKEDATFEEMVGAAKKASIHEFIMSLPDGYQTKLLELGDSVSGGERQRIGIARAFLHGSDILYLDEPTSNIDSLNEGILLKSLKEEREGKTIVFVSHRKSTMGIADEWIGM